MWRLMLLTVLGLAAPVRADELADAVTLMQQCQQRTEACRLLVSSNTGMIKQMLYISTHTKDEKALWESHFSISSYQCIHTVKPDDVVNALQGMYGKYESAEHGTANLIFNAFSIAVAAKCRIEI